MKDLKFFSITLLALLLFSCGTGTSEVKEKQIDETNQEQTKSDDVMEGPKSELLAGLVGEYQLSSAYGSAGANTMYDYQKIGNVWAVSGSSISAGVREGFELEVTDDEINRLNTMKIIVHDDYSVSLECEGETLIEVPYKNDGMKYMLHNSAEDYIMLPEGISEDFTFDSDYLYFYAQDELPEDITSVIDIMQIFGDVAIIRYDIAIGQFELFLFYGECCDASSYYFSSSL